MVDSLRDQLLKLGIKPPVREPAKASAKRHPGKPGNASSGNNRGGGKPSSGRPPASRSQEEIDLAKAYAIRSQVEAQERRRAEREAAEQARIKRENKAKVQRLLEGKALNKPDADQPRHFEYGGKIRRIYVDAAQLAALNAGELGVIQQGGRYLLVGRELAEQVRAIDPHPVALLVEPGSEGGVGEDGVPDDLMW